MPAASSLRQLLRSPRLVRACAVATLVMQGLIAVTGATVRVTGSGLGCPTWPQCFPGSMVPLPNPEVAKLHQIVEFGNRTLTGVVGFAALACLLTAWFVRPRRRRVLALAVAMPLGVLVQAVWGGMTVLTELQWWTVVVHFLLSAVLVWLAALLVKAVGEGDHRPHWLVPARLRPLLVALVVVLAGVLVAGTLVTAAGPHGGDAETPRLDVSVPMLAQVHGTLLVAYLCLLAGFGVGLRHADTTRQLVRSYVSVVVLVLAQGALGSTQYLLGVPEALVVGHVLLAMSVITATATLWTASRYRGPTPRAEAVVGDAPSQQAQPA